MFCQHFFINGEKDYIMKKIIWAGETAVTRYYI